MATVVELLNRLKAAGTIQTVMNNVLAQFGTSSRQYLGATLLPERNVDKNMYRETAITYRTVIANDSTRYSPPQKKGSSIVGSMSVELGNSDIASEFTAQEYDALLDMLGTNQDMQAMAALVQWMDRTINIPLIEKNEQQRWQALIDAQVLRVGDNGYTENVPYPNPSGQRVAAAGQWSNSSYDPFLDIYAIADYAAGKGQTINRIITSRQVLTKLVNNAKVQQRVGKIVINNNGSISGIGNRATFADVNNALQADGLPTIQTYDLQYRTQTGTGYFLKRDVMLLTAATGRDQSIDLGDAEPLDLQDTLGYVGIGRAAGQSAPGRVTYSQAYENKPPRIEFEGWQVSLPVIGDPEAPYVINSIT